ncbi:hypothetical protein L596_024566 [Steinernema carpocapsae]|uniref:Peptidase S1 domain-containing protein n=1 Tax=Steinernema carpocapsae TaxID=34508 RepID=A0A4V5ZZR6_STECR|nr:hypothetical protein L596_024566 [Steinernema carpocapsae]
MTNPNYFLVLFVLLLNWSVVLGSPLIKWSSVYDTENCGLQHIKSVNYSAIDPSLIDDEIENMVGDDYDGGEASANLTSSNPIVESEGLQQKAMGGTAVKDGEMPWAVAIFNKDEYICTGTLVSKKHVLTAAHCFFQKDHGCTFVVPKTVVKDFEVRYGGTCVKSEDPSCEGHDGLKSVKIVS